MKNKLRKFEIIILRPLQIILLLSIILFLLTKAWLSSIACLLGIFYLGIIGSKLHPFQSASDLVKGPLKNELSNLESDMLADGDAKTLVGQACTRIGMLIGFILCVILFNITDISWYLLIGISLFALIIAGSLLKFTFKAI